jgi:hypothetical protein
MKNIEEVGEERDMWQCGSGGSGYGIMLWREMIKNKIKK